MEKLNSKLTSSENDVHVFNAFSHQRFFLYEDNLSLLDRPSPSVDKLSVIDDMLSANITEMTRRSRQD